MIIATNGHITKARYPLHERSKYLFDLLDKYHALTDPKPKRKYTRRKTNDKTI